MDMDGGAKYSAVNMFGFDIGTNMMHMYTLSNTNDVHDHSGGWIDDKNMNLQHSGFKDGKPFAEQLTINIVSNSEYRFKVYEFVAGEMTFMMDGVMKKKK
jgi:hypothetical protein